MFSNIYNKKKVLITGHTGFKGSWLTTWLVNLGADVTGVSKDIPTTPSMFESLNIENKINHYFEDIRNYDALSQIIKSEKPDFIFHLAAQAIVSESYLDPVETISTNVIGTMNVLESVKNFKKKCTVVLITSDKAYENKEWIWGYKETDTLGGSDIYSGSKGAAELVIKSYFDSFLKHNKNLYIGISRAGNVVGGGDWAKNRIVVDCVKSWSKNKIVNIRQPNSTRPWQHVLEPISGYLTLGMELQKNYNINGEAFNFGPNSESNSTVLELITDLGVAWTESNDQKLYKVTSSKKFKESVLLKLNCDKSLQLLNWTTNLKYNEMILFINDWYKNYFDGKDMYKFTIKQIKSYQKLAKRNKLYWAIK